MENNSNATVPTVTQSKRIVESGAIMNATASRSENTRKRSTIGVKGPIGVLHLHH